MVIFVLQSIRRTVESNRTFKLLIKQSYCFCKNIQTCSRRNRSTENCMIYGETFRYIDCGVECSCHYILALCARSKCIEKYEQNRFQFPVTRL